MKFELINLMRQCLFLLLRRDDSSLIDDERRVLVLVKNTAERMLESR